MPDWPDFIDPLDLAPGDRVPHPALPEGIELHVVESPDDPCFEIAFGLLEDEFGAVGEMETRDVLTRRLNWRRDEPVAGCALRYQLMLLRVDDTWVGLRDHTAVLADGEISVHLSHVLVRPSWRRRGLVSLLRTLPVTGARQFAREAGVPQAPVTLFCEMEPLDLTLDANRIRRRSYEKAGFLAIPSGHGYMQPDFRAPELIDADPAGPRPVPFDLLFRRVGREHETTMPGIEVLANVERIYAMYQAGFEPRHMAVCYRWLDEFRGRCPDEFPLHLPTQHP